MYTCIDFRFLCFKIWNKRLFLWVAVAQLSLSLTGKQLLFVSAAKKDTWRAAAWSGLDMELQKKNQIMQTTLTN